MEWLLVYLDYDDIIMTWHVYSDVIIYDEFNEVCLHSTIVNLIIHSDDVIIRI